MTPNIQPPAASYTTTDKASKGPRLSMEGIQRTTSDITFQLSKEVLHQSSLPPISEVEDAKCECCDISEECTLEYIKRIREKFLGKFICGLCGEAVKEEMQKNGGKAKEEALDAHMSACVRFKRLGRTYPVLYQAEAMREILKKASRARGQSNSPTYNRGGTKTSGLARSSSCMPAISSKINDRTMVN